MDISKLLHGLKTLDDYILITQEFVKKYLRSKIRLNMSTVFALKNIKSLELEYFNKTGENGISIEIFKSILNLPPSKTWGLLGKELIYLLKYWIDTIKQFIKHRNWSNFLYILLKFVKDIRTKDPTINSTIIEELSEILLDLSTHIEINLSEQHQIIQCLNLCSAESSREIRFALRSKLEKYFIKLSSLIPQCGDFRVQYSMLETLMRWLLPRQDLSVRKQAAKIWFPTSLFSQNAVDIFLQRSWMNFFKDARDFLNAQNATNDCITSVHCRKLIIGNLELIAETDKKYWLDFNTGNKCISLMLELKLLKILNADSSMSDALVITEDNITSCKMLMESSLIKVEIVVLEPKRMYHSEMLVSQNEVKIYLSPLNAMKVNDSMRKIFEGKYQLLLDLDKVYHTVTENTCESSQIENSEDNTRFSNPVQTRRRKHSGVITRPKKPVSWQSPASTASTSSLALLREKLSALPGCRFDKEPVNVCAVPQLSSVTEVTEIDDNQSLSDASTFQFKSFGVAVMNKSTCERQNLTTNSMNTEKDQSSITHDENSVSCLLVATIGSVDESIINDTLDRLPRDQEVYTDNIVDMLVREALDTKRSVDVNENINTIENDKENTNSEQGKEDLGEEINNNKVDERTDDSNTDVVEDTPNYTMSRSTKSRKELFPTNKEINDPNENNKQVYNSNVVEEFFSQHFKEDKNGDLIISPSLAKKINETSSESSDDFDLPAPNDFQPDFNFNELEIIECLNDLVDKVCEDLEKVSQYMDSEIHLQDITNNMIEAGLRISNVSDKPNKIDKKIKPKKQTPLKLKFNTRKAVKTKDAKKNRNKLQVEAVNKMSIIYETDGTVEESKGDDKNKSPDERLIHRKRKLYSPKDDHVESSKAGLNISETDEDTRHSEVIQYNNTPRFKATSYKEIEQIKRSARRIRKSRTEQSLSPRSKKMNDTFNNLKKTIENNDDIKFVDTKGRNNTSVYNFSSDSDDSDFKGKVIKANKDRMVAPTRSRRNKPRVNYSDSKPKAKRNKNTTRKKVIEVSRNELVDERMRDPAPEELNTSIVLKVPEDITDILEPKIVTPRMEAVKEKKDKINTTRPDRKVKGSKKKDKALKKGHEVEVAVSDVRDKREDSVSPLPALVVETLDRTNDPEDSIVVLDKLKEACENDSSIGKHLDLNTTQNLLSDVEQANYSREASIKNSDSRNSLGESKQRKNKRSAKRTKITLKKKKETPKSPKISAKMTETVNKAKSSVSSGSVSGFKIMEVTAVIENSNRSIPTVGTSPINAHDDYEERPPNFDQLSQKIQPRDLDIEYLDHSIKEYHKTLTKETQRLWTPKELSEEEIESIVRNSPCVSVKRMSLKEISEWIPPRYNSVFGSDQSSYTTKPCRSETRKIIKDKSVSSAKVMRTDIQSSISPIKLIHFEAKSTSDDSYVNKIKSMISRNSKLNRKRCLESVETTSAKKHKVPSIKISSPVGSEKSVLNRSVTQDCMKSMTASSAASSSIKDWLKKSQEVMQSIPSESFDTFIFKDNVNLIMEKLETSLVEIHHSSSWKYSQLFVDVQSQLKQATEKRHDLFKSTALDILDGVVQLVDKKFQELDDRCKEIDDALRNSLKKKTCEFLHEDSKKKQQFVDSLKQEIMRTVPKDK